MITYLIIDDEYMAHDIIKGYCDLLPHMKLLKSCYDALEAIDFLNKNTVDLIFLDLNMPKLKGFDFLRTLHHHPKIIVTTAYQEFALEGYELNISDYLLKPFGFERFLKAINKTFGSDNQLSKLSESSENSNRIFVKTNKKYIQLELDAILYIEAFGNYTKIITSAETLTLREKISTIVDLLPPQDFLQVHKSFVVAPPKINRIEGNRIFISNYEIPIGKTFRSNVMRLLP